MSISDRVYCMEAGRVIVGHPEGGTAMAPPRDRVDSRHGRTCVSAAAARRTHVADRTAVHHSPTSTRPCLPPDEGVRALRLGHGHLPHIADIRRRIGTDLLLYSDRRGPASRTRPVASSSFVRSTPENGRPSAAPSNPTSHPKTQLVVRPRRKPASSSVCVGWSARSADPSIASRTRTATERRAWRSSTTPPSKPVTRHPMATRPRRSSGSTPVTSRTSTSTS